MDISFKRSKPTPEKPSSSLPTDINPDVNKTSTVKAAAISGSKPSFADVAPHKRLKWIFFKPEHVSRKKWLILNAILLIALVLTFIAGKALYKHFTKLPPNQKFQATHRQPTTEPSQLTGVLVKPELNKRPVTGVMIENSPDARPQSGLSEAGVVVEAIAEGGITRFYAMYQEANPALIGPVRSVRPYFVDFARAFDASVAHVGGSPDGLVQVRTLGKRNLDEFANSGSFQRVAWRYAPHNVYTSASKLYDLSKKRGFTSSKFTSLPRKREAPSKQPTANIVGMNISSYYYNTNYDYSASSNCYKRSEGGVKHIDFKSKKQICPKVLIAMVTDYGIASDGHHSKYRLTGSGTVFIFQDGIVTKGKWTKKSNSSQVSFTDSEDKTIKLNPGQTWVTLMGTSSNVSYKK